MTARTTPRGRSPRGGARLIELTEVIAMGSRLKVGTVVVVLLAIGGVTFASAGARDADDGGSTQMIRVVGKEVDSTFLDLGGADLGVGDQFAFSNDLFSGGEKVGEDGGLCIVTRVTAGGATTWKCVGSNTLPGGQITAQGLVTYGPGEEIKADPYLFAITGGTGRYRAARGEVKIEETSAVRLRITFRIFG
jgi:hypothetical protein